MKRRELDLIVWGASDFTGQLVLGEAAVCLAKDELAVAGDFWTPA